MSYRAVLFDLFDTLLYVTETGDRRKAIARVASLGVTEAQWRQGWGASFELASRGRFTGLEGRVRWVLREVGLARLEASLVEEITALLRTRERPHLYADVPESVRILRERGYAVGLISNIATDERDMAYAFGLRDMLTPMVLSCDVGLAKPEREVYLVAAARLGREPAECVFVDDQPAYVAAAREIGMGAVRIQRPNAHDAAGSPDRRDYPRITSLQELLASLPKQALK